MHQELRDAFTAAIKDSLKATKVHLPESTEPYLVWRKVTNGRWEGKFVARPNIGLMILKGINEIEEAETEFLRLLQEKYPDHWEFVGFPSFGRTQILRWRAHIVGEAIQTIWRRHGSFDVDLAVIESIVNEFGKFLDRPVSQFSVLAQLLNFEMPAEQIEINDGLRIRRLSQEEVSQLHGGPMGEAASSARNRIHEFAIEGEFEESKSVGDSDFAHTPKSDEIGTSLDKAVVAMRTFKAGPVGYDSVQFRSVHFCPIPQFTIGHGSLYIPPGRYRVDENEIDSFGGHLARYFGVSETSMDIACRRLADAEIRLRPEDRMVDAVIGLEALLLSSLSGADRRGELKYRFSVHYSTLFETPTERYRAFRLAKDIYDLRSSIAHGSKADKERRVGDEKLSLDAAARRACEVLREVIDHFLTLGSTAYKSHEFWERGFFGLPLNEPECPDS